HGSQSERVLRRHTASRRSGAATMNTSPLLEVRNLSLSVRGPRGTRTPILRGLSLCLESQAVHGLVGESGGGKTMVGKAILGVLPDGARIDSGSIWFDGQDLTLL